MTWLHIPRIKGQLIDATAVLSDSLRGSSRLVVKIGKVINQCTVTGSIGRGAESAEWADEGDGS